MASTPPPHSQSHPSGRKRARRACIPCRRRKRKCDGTSPCQMCTRYEYDCQYDGEDSVHPGHAPSPDTPIQDVPVVSAAIDPVSTLVDQTSNVNVDDTRRGILDPAKRRFMNQSSAIAFPKQLAADLESANPPRLHSFAWNTGIRGEELPSTHVPLTQLITFQDYQKYSEIYFSIVNRAFGVLCQQEFTRQCQQFWKNSTNGLTRSALIAGVVALGSMFAFRGGHLKEAEIVKHVKDILEDPSVVFRPTIDQINAWVLRTLYLRSTTRPHSAWLASCTAMHQAEAMGLHHDVKSFVFTSDANEEAWLEEKGRRAFWIAWSINTTLSYEYGRSRVTFDIVSRGDFDPGRDYPSQLVRLALLIPDEATNVDPVTRAKSLHKAMQQLRQMPDVSEFTALARADVCFCFYRRLRLLKIVLERDVIQTIVNIGRTAVETAVAFARKSVPWWNILNTTFQFFCVLLSIDDSSSLSEVSWVLKSLEEIVVILGTHLASEALDTAKILLRDSMSKKKRQLSLLSQADDATTPATLSTSGDDELNIDWDALLDPFGPVSLEMPDFFV